MRPYALFLSSVLMAGSLPAASILVSVNTDGFKDSNCSINSAMSWGLVFDTTGDGFGNFSNFVPTIDGFLPIVNPMDQTVLATSDDYYQTMNPGAQIPNTPSFTLNNIFLGGQGGLISDINVPFDLPGIVPESGQSFGLLWTDGIGYGFFTDSSFVLPPGGPTELPIETVVQDLLANDPNDGGAKIPFAQVIVVPEPSSALLAAFLGLGLISRRRR